MCLCRSAPPLYSFPQECFLSVLQLQHCLCSVDFPGWRCSHSAFIVRCETSMTECHTCCVRTFKTFILLPVQEEPKKVCFNYDLFLNLEGNPPVNHLRCEKLTFNNPTKEFRRKLIKAGGVRLPDTLARSQADWLRAKWLIKVNIRR